MSVNKVDKTTGELTVVAGKNVSTMVPSVALQQSGSVSGASALVTTLGPGSFTILTVSLPTSMPDSNYVVQAGTDSAYILAEESPSVRGTTSFRLYLTNQSLTETVDVSVVTIFWQAFRLVSDQTTALDEQAIAKRTAFPDYAHPLTVASTTAWTATEDCYVVYHYSAAGSSYTEAGQLYINGNRVDGGDFGGSNPGTTNSFSGYLKKGDILTRQGNQSISSSSNCFRFFPLRT